MAELKLPTLPTYDHLIWPTVEVLRQLGGSGTIQEIESKVHEMQGHTDAQIAELHAPNRSLTEIGYRLMWSRTYLKNYGAIENSSRGIWALTPKGQDLSLEEARTIPQAIKREYYARTRQQLEEAPLETVLDEYSEDNWKQSLLGQLLSMPPTGFERLCQRLLREKGFTEVTVTGRSGDEGIDGAGVLQLSLVSFRVIFQCKRWRSNVGASTVRDFRGAMQGRADKGIIISTSGYTAEASKEATRDGAPVIDLIDGDQLCDLIRDCRLGVETREVVFVDSGFFQSM